MAHKLWESEGAPFKKEEIMPVKYECYVCKTIFSYTQIVVEVECPNYNDRYINVSIPCKQSTFTRGLGGTGDDYICGECIKEAVTHMKG